MEKKSILYPHRILSRNLVFNRHRCKYIFCYVIIFLQLGCRTAKDETFPRRLAEPVLPCGEILANEIIYSEEDLCRCLQQERPKDDLVAELILSYVNAGRDFREPAGPDGFVIKVIPLDNEYHPRKITGDVFVSLYDNQPEPENSSEKPLIQWHIPQARLDEYWTPMRLLDCYLFRLDWGEGNSFTGDYRLRVQLVYRQKDKLKCICKEIVH